MVVVTVCPVEGDKLGFFVSVVLLTVLCLSAIHRRARKVLTAF